MNIVTYVKKNYDKLPKSTFNSHENTAKPLECVIVKEIQNEDWGYGHHSYEGIGIGRGGEIYWCFSSGCSCEGSCGMDHVPTTKSLQVEEWNLRDIDYNTCDFKNMQVDFANY